VEYKTKSSTMLLGVKREQYVECPGIVKIKLKGKTLKYMNVFYRQKIVFS
jgi:hypothetical protein